jgi:hypothetical protein
MHTFCRYEPEDVGVHTVCSVVTEDFLKYTKYALQPIKRRLSEWPVESLSALRLFCPETALELTINLWPWRQQVAGQ